MSDRPSDAYRRLVATGEVRDDPVQVAAVAKLDALHQQLLDYAPPKPGGLLTRLGLTRADRSPPAGLYLHGPVGRGKTMLMDLFFERAPVAAKRRVHFHAFMLEVHARLNRQRQESSDRREPLAALGADLADEAWLLCFDEFHVHDIGDAMILGRLFEALLARGVVVVATSNFAPEHLYEGGLNRDRFLPFIGLLQARLDVVALAGQTDYRMARLRDVPVFHCPLGAATDRQLAAAFAALTDGAPGEPEVIAVGTRSLTVPRAARGVAWFDFPELCEQPLGAADYLALAQHYHTVILSGVPALTPDKRNEARRFITLVDVLYERHANLIMGAEVSPDRLYASGDGAFEFQRTVSRLMEMQSREYIESPPLAGRAAADFVPFALTTDVI